MNFSFFIIFNIICVLSVNLPSEGVLEFVLIGVVPVFFCIIFVVFAIKIAERYTMLRSLGVTLASLRWHQVAERYTMLRSLALIVAAAV